MSYLRPYNPAVEYSHAPYSMDDPDYCEFIKREFYWPGQEMNNSAVIKLMKKYNANRLGVDKNGHTTLQAPLLVAIRTNNQNDCILMLVRKIMHCRSRTSTERNQVALVSQCDLSLKAIHTPIPSMCFEPWSNTKGIRSVHYGRVSPTQWYVPEICIEKTTGERGVVWTGIRHLLGLKGRGMDPCDILHRVEWATGDWDNDTGPTERLAYSHHSLSATARLANLCNKTHSLPIVPSRTDADRLSDLDKEGWVPQGEIDEEDNQSTEGNPSLHIEEEHDEASASNPLPPPPKYHKRGRRLDRTTSNHSYDERDDSPVRSEVIDLTCQDEDRPSDNGLRQEMLDLIDSRFGELTRRIEERQSESQKQREDDRKEIHESFVNHQARLDNYDEMIAKLSKNLEDSDRRIDAQERCQVIMKEAIETNQKVILAFRDRFTHHSKTCFKKGRRPVSIHPKR